MDNHTNPIDKLSQVENSIIECRGQRVILDSDVAKLYGVETRIVNQAVKNNPDKFPDGYILIIDNKEIAELRSKNLITNVSPMSRALPKAFTERGLYMLATILKSPVATATTLAIVETFAKIRELARTVGSIADEPDKNKQQSMLKRTGEILSDIIDPELTPTASETTLELNLSVLKIKHTVKRSKNNRTK